MVQIKREIRFNDAVDGCVDIKGRMQKGLSAMGAYSKTVKATDTKKIDGSVDIDRAVKSIYPNDSRWDYVVGYANEAYFIEVHPADTKNVEEMIGKVKWLKKWLDSSAPDLKVLNRNKEYYWVPSGRVRITKGSTQFKQIAANNLQIKNRSYFKSRPSFPVLPCLQRSHGTACLRPPRAVFSAYQYCSADTAIAPILPYSLSLSSALQKILSPKQYFQRNKAISQKFSVTLHFIRGVRLQASGFRCQESVHNAIYSNANHKLKQSPKIEI